VTVQDIRSKYLEFFKARGHNVIPSASLVPENDPTTLFTGSGMQPLLPYLLGKDHPLGSRLADSQRCFRAQDIEEVGDNRHTTYFEMLGNWSLGDYFKKEQLPWFFEFLTKEIGLPKEKLWVTCFEGDEQLGIPKDTESAEIWKGLGIDPDHIRFYGAKNWWSRSGTPDEMPAGEPGGPDSEVFYEFTHVEHDPKFGTECHPNCDCGRFLEIGNSVFMQYIKKEDGSFALLPKQNVDFGGGLERIAAASINSPDVFLIDVFAPTINKLEELSGKKYTDNPRPFRIIADHIRAARELIADGVVPGSVERGYVLRRLIRRAVRYADMLGLPSGSLGELSTSKEIAAEEERFRKTLARGEKELARFASSGSISAQDAFQLVTTYGFPFELIVEEAGERGIKHIDVEGFKELLKEHEALSRAGAQQKFKGGLADTSEKTTRLHTAHHLLLKALQLVLGPEVHQRGSNITQERLRIDFNYGQKMTKEQLAQVEKIVNEKIQEGLPVVRTEMSREEAEALHAEHEFGAKYPERVSVYSIGPLSSAFSIEFCGGPHVSNTRELGHFKIQKEEAVAQGIRRIKAILE
jgi:alanyl-tRNA synthetase